MRYTLLIVILCSIIIILVGIVYNGSIENFENKTKIINLVLYSNDNEYDKMYYLTKQYYRNFENVKTIYYTFNENILDEYELKDDILNIKGNETYIPGILDKTIKAFEYIKNNFDYDYVVRSNISTIVDFDLLTKYLQDTPIEYGGGLNMNINNGDENEDIKNIPYASGTSIILSESVLKKFLNKKQYIRRDLIDDVAIGVLMNNYLPNINQQYISENRFIFISDENGNASKIIESIKDKNYIFYRNRQPNRKTDIKQMEVIIAYLQNKKRISDN